VATNMMIAGEVEAGVMRAVAIIAEEESVTEEREVIVMKEMRETLDMIKETLGIRRKRCMKIKLRSLVIGGERCEECCL